MLLNNTARTVVSPSQTNPGMEDRKMPDTESVQILCHMPPLLEDVKVTFGSVDQALSLGRSSPRTISNPPVGLSRSQSKHTPVDRLAGGNPSHAMPQPSASSTLVGQKANVAKIEDGIAITVPPVPSRTQVPRPVFTEAVVGDPSAPPLTPRGSGDVGRRGNVRPTLVPRGADALNRPARRDHPRISPASSQILKAQPGQVVPSAPPPSVRGGPKHDVRALGKKSNARRPQRPRRQPKRQRNNRSNKPLHKCFKGRFRGRAGVADNLEVTDVDVNGNTVSRTLGDALSEAKGDVPDATQSDEESSSNVTPRAESGVTIVSSSELEESESQVSGGHLPSDAGPGPGDLPPPTLHWPVLSEEEFAILTKAGLKVENGTRASSTPMCDAVLCYIYTRYPGVYVEGITAAWALEWQNANPQTHRLRVGEIVEGEVCLTPTWELRCESVLARELCVEFDSRTGDSFIILPWGLEPVVSKRDQLDGHVASISDWSVQNLHFYSNYQGVPDDFEPSYRRRVTHNVGPFRGDPNRRTAPYSQPSIPMKVKRYYLSTKVHDWIRSWLVVFATTLMAILTAWMLRAFVVEFIGQDSGVFDTVTSGVAWLVSRFVERPKLSLYFIVFSVLSAWLLSRHRVVWVLVPESLLDVAKAHIAGNPKYDRWSSFPYLVSLCQTHGVTRDIDITVVAVLDCAEREFRMAEHTHNTYSWLPQYALSHVITHGWENIILLAVGLVMFEVLCLTTAGVNPVQVFAVPVTAITSNVTAMTIYSQVDFRGDLEKPNNQCSIAELENRFYYKPPTVPPVPSFEYDPSAVVVFSGVVPVMNRFATRHLRQIGPVINPSSAPVSYASDWDSMLGGLARQLGNKPCDPSLMRRYVAWFHSQFIPFVYDLVGHVKPIGWQDFLNRQPLAMRTLYQSAKQRYEGLMVQYPRDRMADLFGKVEKLDPQYDPDFSIFAVAGKKAQRVITNTSKNQCFRTGPWFVALAKRLALLCNNESPLFYTSGTVPSQVGAFVGKCLDYGLDLFENDCSKWDGHQREECLLCLIDLFERLGMDPELVHQYREDVRFSARYRNTRKTDLIYPFFTISVSVNGTQGSGRPETSVGNTLMNFSFHLFADYVQRDPETTIAQQLTWLRIMALGDDNVSGVSPDKTWDLSVVESVFKGLGHSPKLKRRDISELEFCSSWFIPSNDGLSFTLVPKLGRLVSRMPWHVVPGRALSVEERAARLRGDLLGRRGVLKTCPYLCEWYENLFTLAAAVTKRSVTDRLNLAYNLWVDEEVEWNSLQRDAFFARYGLPPARYTPFETLADVRVDFYFASMLEKDIGEEWVDSQVSYLVREDQDVVGPSHEIGRLPESDFKQRYPELLEVGLITQGPKRSSS